ncbi:hypothetical protein VTJ83DRAFT_5353 [Remersonia thermophila]|uniref:2',3'-cyclic-nucleotide 3'-phosphodiesterase n=1 Tax=Remersonia thermophila TaxID=72144 RepID=A0ABR4D819_9PEZI
MASQTFSIWLLPPPSHPLRPLLSDLIHRTLPGAFPHLAASPTANPPVAPHFFPPHITLASSIPAAHTAEDAPGGPQAFLERVFAPLLQGNDDDGEKTGFKVRVRPGEVDGQDHFFRRCFVRIGLDGGVRTLAGVATAGAVLGEEVSVVGTGADGELEVSFGEKTQQWLRWWEEAYGPHLSLMYGDQPISGETLKKVAEMVREAGVRPAKDVVQDESQHDGEGWEGGEIWLVPTYKPISEWSKPIATIQL